MIRKIIYHCLKDACDLHVGLKKSYSIYFTIDDSISHPRTMAALAASAPIVALPARCIKFYKLSVRFRLNQAVHIAITNIIPNTLCFNF